MRKKLLVFTSTFPRWKKGSDDGSENGGRR